MALYTPCWFVTPVSMPCIKTLQPKYRDYILYLLFWFCQNEAIFPPFFFIFEFQIRRLCNYINWTVFNVSIVQDRHHDLLMILQIFRRYHEMSEELLPIFLNFIVLQKGRKSMKFPVYCMVSVASLSQGACSVGSFWRANFYGAALVKICK